MSLEGEATSQEPATRRSQLPETPEEIAARLLEETLGGVTPLEILNLAIRRWRLVLGLPAVSALLGLVFSYVVPPTYRATTSFTPEGRPALKALGSLAGLAGLAGVSLGGDPNQSPLFYAKLAKSRELLRQIVLEKFPDRTGTAADSAVLLDIMQVRGRDLETRLDRAFRRLSDAIVVDVERLTSIVTIKVDARDPVLAQQIANRLFQKVNTFNLRNRQSEARERRKFAEERRDSAAASLAAAEAELASWLRRNRIYETSPQLVFERQRLQRQVDLRQEVFVTLSRELETARIEEVNSTPLITQIDPAVVPVRPARPSHAVWAIVSLLVGGLVGVMASLGGEHLNRARNEGARDYREFERLLVPLRRLVGKS